MNAQQLIESLIYESSLWPKLDSLPTLLKNRAQGILSNPSRWVAPMNYSSTQWSKIKPTGHGHDLFLDDTGEIIHDDGRWNTYLLSRAKYV